MALSHSHSSHPLLTGVVAIAVTGVVFHAVLARLLDLESWALVANNLPHTLGTGLLLTGRQLVAAPRSGLCGGWLRFSVLLVRFARLDCGARRVGFGTELP
jgi:hypothetical protein